MDFKLLGPLVVSSGYQLLPVSAAKQRVILAQLLLRANRVVPTDHLIDSLWPDGPPATARVTLQNYIRRLRKVFENYGELRIRTVEPGYQIDIDSQELDVFRFEALCQDAADAARADAWKQASSRLRQALDLWRGEPLVDVPCPTLCLEIVPRLTEARLQALESWIEAELHLARHAELTPELMQLVAEYPFRERLHRLLMLAYYRSGRQSEALETFRRARGVLQKELGIEPGAELQRLHRQILAGDAAILAPSPPPDPANPRLSLWQLPRRPHDFTGHEAQVQALSTVLLDADRSETMPVAAVVGPVGVGKTALSVHTAHLVSPCFPDGQLYADLGGSSMFPVPTREVLARFLRDLGGDDTPIPIDEQSAAARYRSLLRGKRMLVVLDDVSGADQVRDLLPGAGGCAVVMTSRERLLDLDGAHMVTLGPLDEQNSLELFRKVVGAKRVDEELPDVLDLLDVCGGLPLAIRIAAIRLAAHPNWPVSRFARRFADPRRSLDEFSVSGKTLRSSYRVSYERLLPQVRGSTLSPRRAFRMLSLFDGPAVGLRAAAALFGLPTAQVEVVLEYLVDAHMLAVSEPGRYGYDRLLRSYALECAEAEESEAARVRAVDRVLSWYLTTAGMAAQAIDPLYIHPEPLDAPSVFSSSAEALRWLETERGNLVAAARQAARGDPDRLSGQLPAIIRHLFGVFGQQAPSGRPMARISV